MSTANMTHCEAATPPQEVILLTGLYLVALGTGGLKAALPSMGADQFDERNPKEAASLSSFFNWYMFFLVLGAILGVTVVVWISSNHGWDWAFTLCALAVAMGILFLCMGKSTYRTNVPKGSPLVRILQVCMHAVVMKLVPSRVLEVSDLQLGQVFVAAVRNFNQPCRFLDRAAAIVMSSSDTHSGWKLCTVTQVEETKILIRMMPIILSTVFMNTCLAQLQTFTIQQSTTMDRSLGSFQFPGASIPVIPLLFMFILIPIYDRIFVPLARKFTGIPTGITKLQRVAIGLVLSISVFWLGIQYAIFGMADMFTAVGLMEFFYAESSSGMKSLGTAISWCSLAFGYYTSTIVVNVVNKVSRGWLSSNNLNQDRLEYFYWLLAGLSVVNFGVYVLCASWYKYKKVEEIQQESSCSIDVSIVKNGTP